MTTETTLSATLSVQPKTLQSGDGPFLPIKRVSVLEVGFDCLTMHEVLDHIQRLIEARLPRQICLANAYTVSLAQKDAELQGLLAQAHLVLADGMSIVWGSRWIQLRIPGRIAGPDLTTELCSLSATKGYRLFLLGSTEDNLQQLRAVLTGRWPGLQIVGTYSPPFADRLSEPDNARIYQELERAKPDILFVSMSTPKQEKWISDHLAKLDTPLCIGVGAAFDFLSGRIPRAPSFFQKNGLEWLYRLWREPRRLWKRYILGNFAFLALLARQAVRMKLHRSSPPKS